MRTDVKIGIGVGLLVAVVAVTYFVLAERKPEGPAEGQPAKVAEKDRVNRPDFGTPPERTGRGADTGIPGVVITGLGDRPTPREEPPPAERETPPTPREETRPAREPEDVDVMLGGGRGTPSRETPTPAEGPTEPEPGPSIARGPSLEPGPSLRPEPSPAVEPVVPPVREEPSPIPVEPLAGPKTYTVQSGDQGYWGIAQRPEVYGDGKYWYLIAKANPNADSSNLKVGQKLTIPPKPTASAPGAPAAGGLATDVTTGRKVYVVQQGDAGFWGIAQRKEVYGNGKYWELIAKANPSANSSSLHVGQTLIIPPLPTETARPGPVGPASPITPTPEPTPGPGQSIYVVEKGDAGFWDVARKKYGDGNLWSAIAHANPSVDATKLQIGQKLVLPSLEQAKSMVATTPPPGPATRPGTAPAPARPATSETGEFRRPIFRR